MMTKLHLISNPINSAELETQLSRYACDGDNLLFIGDSVTSCLQIPVIATLKKQNYPVYLHIEDCQARGISQALPTDFIQIGSEQMVDLTITALQTLSW